MRATEFIHYLKSKSNDKHEYSHLDLFEVLDVDGKTIYKMKDKYKKAKRKFRAA
tara:strand:- start:22 stop:183 length:162 start_codon:yes stop_codon:yes gene_type:complete